MKNNIRYLAILIALTVIIIVMTIYILFFNSSQKTSETETEFIKNMLIIQSNLSYYIGSTYSETFGIYDKETIIKGTENTNEQENIKQLQSLVNSEEKIEENGVTAYKVNIQNIESVLKIDLPSYEGIDFYIQNGDTIKVNFNEVPTWWTEICDIFKVGK